MILLKLNVLAPDEIVPALDNVTEVMLVAVVAVVRFYATV
jgi:hypothetical protein